MSRVRNMQRILAVFIVAFAAALVVPGAASADRLASLGVSPSVVKLDANGTPQGAIVRYTYTSRDPQGTAIGGDLFEWGYKPVRDGWEQFGPNCTSRCSGQASLAGLLMGRKLRRNTLYVMTGQAWSLVGGFPQISFPIQRVTTFWTR